MNNRLHNLFQATPRYFLWLVLGVVMLAGGATAYAQVSQQPKVISPEGASLGITDVSNTQPMIITFSHPVNEQTLAYEIHPELAGTWELTSSLLASTASLRFTPTESPDLDTRYTIALSGIRGILDGTEEAYLLSFQTAALPVLQAVSPAHASGDILPDAAIVLTFDTPVTDATVVSGLLTPTVPLGPPEVKGTTVTFSPTEPLQKSTAYEFRAFVSKAKTDYATGTRTVSEEKTEIIVSTFTTIAAPGIEAFAPTGSGVGIGTGIQIDFLQEMSRESTQAAFSLSPSVAGTFAWEDNRTMTFTPATPLAKNQVYTVTLANTAAAASGLTLETPFSFSFTTLGLVVVSGFTPSNGTTGVDPATTLRISFNQEVDHASAEASTSLSPSVEGSYSWDGTTLLFDPTAALANGTSYTLSVGKGVVSVGGLDSVADFSTSFTTKSKSVMMNVPAYAQAHMYSCEIAAARSALAYRGVRVSEADIISRVGKDTTPWSGTWGEEGSVWGDPDKGIVGDLDGSANDIGWGYGSHWAPIAKALTSYGILNEVKTGMSVQDLAQSLADGNPVIIWWVNGVWPAYEVRWKTPDGKDVRGVNSLHVQVVRGFTGTVDEPVSFTVTDSGYGYPGRTLDVGTFKAKWSWFGNTGIIVK